MYAYKSEIHIKDKDKPLINKYLNDNIKLRNNIYTIIDNYFEKTNQLIPKTILEKKIINIRNISYKGMQMYTLKSTLNDAYREYIKYTKHIINKPTKKDNITTRKSLYIAKGSISIEGRTLTLNNIYGIDNIKTKLLVKDIIPKYEDIIGVILKFELGKYYVILSIDKQLKKEVELTNKILGIDMNIKKIVTSDNTVYSSIIYNENYRKCEKNLKTLKEKFIKKENYYKKINQNPTSKNYYKLRNQVWKKYRRLNNLSEDHINKVVSDIMKKKPKIIKIEDLCVKEMMLKKENDTKEQKSLRKGIYKNPFYKFINTLEQRAEKYGIKVIKINRYYPSSKMCSNCKHIKKDLTLKDRIYKCEVCGLSIDRDLNAAINISQY